MAEPERPFPAGRAFVLQLHADADVETGAVAGRVEHLASGRVTHFGSLVELMRFIAMVTASEEKAPPR
jgi:hypothetical protein